MSTKLLAVALALAALLPAQVPPDAEIRKILAQRIDEYRQSVGIVVGVIDSKGRRIVSYGALEKGDPRPLNGDTVFEIGSITKAFTGLLLADMAQHGELAITDPVAKYLPAEVKVPQRGGKQIRLEDLATHTSGLPRLPSNLKPKDPANPYADYTVEQMYQFISTYELPRDIDSHFEYSNLGFGLLGHALARRAGVSYEALVASRIAKPLGMNSTAITLTPEMKSRLAVGHNEKLERVSNWDLPTMAGAGALRSTANDMLNFLAAALGYTETPLAPAFTRMLSVRRPAGAGMESALGWQIFSRDGADLVWKDGGTGGYGTFIGYDSKTRAGVVVLANSFVTSGALTGVDDIGQHLLNAAFPLNQPPKQHTETSVDPKIFDRYTGLYQAGPQMTIAITREGEHLYAQATGQIRFELFPENEKDYFAKIADISVTFQTDAQGKANAMVLHQGGGAVTIHRADGEAPPAPKQHKEVAVDPKLLDGYVGRYQFAPGVTLTISREGDALFAQLTGQEKFPIFPEGAKEYFFKVVDAQVTFETDAQGRATALILHQNGVEQQAKRME